MSIFEVKEFKGHAHLNSINSISYLFQKETELSHSDNFIMMHPAHGYLLAADERVSFLAIETDVV